MNLLRNKRHPFIGFIASAVGVSLIVQALAFLRHILIAAYYGISRDLDVYLVGYAIITIIVFTLGVVFDTIAVPHLVSTREQRGEEAAGKLGRAIFFISCLVALAMSAVFIAATPLLSTIMAAGFSEAERTLLAGLSWYFLPWSMSILPFYAVAAVYKSSWRFNRVFTAEIVVALVSIISLVAWHGGIYALPVAYGAGYAAGLVWLAIGSGIFSGGSVDIKSSGVRKVLRNMGELYLANQTGSLSGMVDRYYQSITPAGSIAAVNYSGQIVNGLSALLNFREIYIAPLSESTGREQKLERLLTGLGLIIIPVTGYIFCMAADIVQVLFVRGRFDEAAAAVTTEVLTIYAFVLVPSGIGTPLFRMFQIIDKIRFTNVVYASSIGFLALFGYLFIVVAGMGARGIAFMFLGNSLSIFLLTAVLIAKSGIVISWARIGKYVLYASLAAGTASAVTYGALPVFGGAWPRMLGGTLVYGLIVSVFYWFVRDRIKGIAR